MVKVRGKQSKGGVRVMHVLIDLVLIALFNVGALMLGYGLGEMYNGQTST
jgi:hypothetical protein